MGIRSAAIQGAESRDMAPESATLAAAGIREYLYRDTTWG